MRASRNAKQDAETGELSRYPAGLLTHVEIKTGSSRGNMEGKLNTFSLEEIVLKTLRKGSMWT